MHTVRPSLQPLRLRRATGLASALLWAGTALAADKIVMNLGWSTPADSAYSVPAKKFKELAEKYTNGAVEVKLRCCEFHEFSKHLIILDHFAGVAPMFASDRMMKKLGAEHGAAIRRAAAEAGAYHTEVQAKETAEVRQWLVEKGGMKMTSPPRAPFIAAAQKVQQQFAAEGGPKFAELVNLIQAAAK